MSRNKALTPRRALVVFSDRVKLAWLKILKRGFRHCFVIVEGGQGGAAEPSSWVIYNPLSHCTEIASISGLTGSAIVLHYRAMGFRVVETLITRPSRRPAPWRAYTCVEAVKRVLGLRAAGVFTPWQMHNFLKNTNKSKKVLTKGIKS